jgi:hypothetical protein
MVGAGASTSSPTSALREGLKRMLREDIFETNARVYFGKTYAECTLEELFSIYARIRGADAVRTFLVHPPRGTQVKIVRDTEDILPNVGYEFLAHLVHHKLINNIITTNFDEELEISLDDEMGRESYRLIRGLSEFDAFVREMERQEQEGNSHSMFESQILLKAHGTISYPITMRSTIEKVKRFGKRKSKLIGRILHDTDIFIIAGYSFRDTDFKNVFFETMDERRANSGKMRIYWIDKNWREDTCAGNETYKAMDEMFKDKISIKCLPIESDKFFEKLAKRIEELDKQRKRIPRIARHNVRNLILKKAEGEVNKNKLLLEVIIFAVKAKGLFGIDALSDCIRIQTHYKKLGNKNASFLHSTLERLEKCNLIRQVEKGRGIYCIPTSGSGEIEQLAKKIVDLFNLSGKLNLNERDELIKLLKTLKDDFDVDITRPDAGTYFLFGDPKTIRDHEEWDLKTKELLESAKELKIIAQTGEWITKSEDMEKFLRGGGTVKLIASEKLENAGMHSDRQKDIESKLLKMVKGHRKRLQIEYLPLEEISEHIKLNDETRKGMYMKRIAKSPTVSPVWVEEQDYGVLQAMFKYYWGKALRFKNSQRVQKVRSAVHPLTTRQDPARRTSSQSVLSQSKP